MAQEGFLINLKGKNESFEEATVTPPVSWANRRVGLFLKSFNGCWTRRLDSHFLALTSKLFSIGLDVLRTLDLNYFSRIWLVFSRVGQFS